MRHDISACATLLLRWHGLIARRRRRHGLPGPLVISITSYAPRFRTLSLTLKCLLRQTVQTDHIILWVAHADYPKLPKDVLSLRDAGLTIRTTEDLLSYKKILPTLDAYPNAFICTADDDVYYWPTWLEELIERADAAGRTIVCHRAREVSLDHQRHVKPYAEWPVCLGAGHGGTNLFPTGSGGVLYPPGLLAHSADYRDAALELCPHGDDIWLYWLGRKNGATYRLTAKRRNLTVWHDSQTHALWFDNVRNGGNDDQIAKMVARFGLPGAPAQAIACMCPQARPDG